MKVVFVDLLNLFYDQHGIYSIAGALKQENIDVGFIGTRNQKLALERIARLKPDLLLYSAFSATIPLYMDFDRKVKDQMNVRSLIGGPGPTFGWQQLSGSTIDAVCIGEGETAIVEFIKNGFKDVPNIFRPGNSFPTKFFPLVDLDRLPLPDRSVVYDVDSLLRRFPSKQFLSGRGCPYDCSYCFNHQFREMFKDCGPVIRKKSVGRLIEEIRQVRARYPLKTVVFNDDTFIVDKRWFLEFAEKFRREIGLEYTCNVRANLVDDEVAQALDASGCRGVNWSIESGNEQMRHDVLRRKMSNEQIYHAGRALTRYRIKFRIGNLLGLPGETTEQMLETLEMNIKVKPELGLANIFVPFPGLALTEYALTHGHCSQTNLEHLPKDYFTSSVMNFTDGQKSWIYKLFCLFPIFVAWPVLFYNKKWRDMLFALPALILRFIYEIYYIRIFARLYIPKVSFLDKCRIAKRYLFNL